MRAAPGALLLSLAALIVACAQRPAGSGAHAQAVPPEPRMVETIARPPAEAWTPPPPLAAADRSKIFPKCAPCHTLVPGRQGLGPSLAGVYGRRAGSLSDFRYSDAMARSGIVWNAATLDRYLTNPAAMIPGTKMTFRGLDSPADRAQVIAFLQRH